MRVVAALATCALVGCGASVPGGDATPGDGAPDAPLGAFAFIQKIPALSTDLSFEDDGTVSAGETELVFALRIPGEPKDLYRSMRPSPGAPFEAPTRMPNLSTTTFVEHGPRMTADELTIYFASDRTGTIGGDDVWMSTRAAIGDPWGDNVMRVDYASSDVNDRAFSPCSGGRYVMMSIRDGGDGDLFEGALGSAPAIIGELSTPANEASPYLTQDCLHLVYASDATGDYDLHIAHRETIDGAWIADGRIAEVSLVGSNETDPWISADLRRLILASTLDGEVDIYETSR